VGRTLEVRNLGVVEYDDGLELQDALRQSVGRGELPDQLLLLEHPPVVTVGRNSDGANVLLAEEELAKRGIGLYETGRGGDVTFHGPGQVVGYPIVDLNPDRRDVHRYVRDLEEVMIRALEDFGVRSGRIPGLTGVWVGDLKVAAIGVRISRWITSHGFAFNVGTDLGYFRTIVPCGIEDRGVTSLESLLREVVPMKVVRDRLTARFAEVFERTPLPRRLAGRSVQVLVWRRTDAGLQVLMLKRTERDGGFWQPVTGLIEEGESPADAARRETSEETGLRGEPVSLEYVRDFRIGKRWIGGDRPEPWINREHAFALEVDGDPEIRLSPGEHEEVQWTTPDRARELMKWNGNRRALERLEQRIARAQ
jgi:lipoyl(octanoyl) transferase